MDDLRTGNQRAISHRHACLVGNPNGSGLLNYAVLHDRSMNAGHGNKNNIAILKFVLLNPIISLCLIFLCIDV
jgi:hypothetical protein